MKKQIKKAFTLVELLVVIAILAILGTVGIVGYTSFINKANKSADEQAVTQMNVVLQANEVLEGKSIYEVFDALKESGLVAEDYKPLTKDTYFFWDQDLNRIVYTDKDYKVIWPEQYAGKTKSNIGSEEHQWYTLTSEIAKEEYSVQAKSGDSSTKVVSVSTPGSFYSLGQDLNEIAKGEKTSNGFTASNITNDGSLKGLTGKIEINLDKDIDMMGATFTFMLCNANFTINGNGHKITGIVNNKDFQVSNTNINQSYEKYGTAIVGYAQNSTVSFNNVTIENCVFGMSDAKGSASLVGYTYNSSISINGVNVKNCDMIAYGHSCGGFVADVQSSTDSVNFTGSNKLEDVTLTVVQEGTGSSAQCYGAGEIVGRYVPKTGYNSKITGKSSIYTNNVTKVYGSGTACGNSKNYPFIDLATMA